MGNKWVLAIIFVIQFSSVGNGSLQCNRGTRLHTPRQGSDVCLDCDDGTFMDEENHFSRTCKPCTKIENGEVEVLVRACNRTHDTEILCTSGFYRRKVWDVQEKDRCEKCTECDFPARNCEGYNDTVCCLPNRDAVMSPSGMFLCKERSIVCGPGQFFNSLTKECKLCPEGTYMSDHNHTHTDCFKCQQLSDNNPTFAVIIRHCSRTAPTLFGCEKGYFRDPTQESTQIEVPCTPWRSCSQSLIDCGMFQDAGCDHQGLTAPTTPINITRSTGNVDDVITQLKSLNAGIWDSCVLQCVEDLLGSTETNVAQSESRAKNCFKNCLYEIHKPNMVAAWLRAVLCILLSIFCTLTGWYLKKNVTTCNFRNRCSYFAGICRNFTRVLIIFNTMNSCLFILNACLETKLIENRFLFLITTAVCYSLLFANPALLFIFVNNAGPENHQRRNADQSSDAQTGQTEDSEESQFVAPPVKNKETSTMINLQRGDS